MCTDKQLWLVRRVPHGLKGNLTRSLDLEIVRGYHYPADDFITRPIVGIYLTEADATKHPLAHPTATAWAVIKRMCDPGWDYLPDLIREVRGAVTLYEDNEEYVRAVFTTELAARLFLQEWECKLEHWPHLTL